MPELEKSLWLFPSMSVNSAGVSGILFRDQLARPIRLCSYLTSYLTKMCGRFQVDLVSGCYLVGLHAMFLKSFFISLLRFRIFSRRNYFHLLLKKSEKIWKMREHSLLLIIINNWHRVEAYVLPSVP